MSIIFADVPTGFLSVSGVWGPAMPFGAPSISFPLEQQGQYARLYAQPYIVHTGADVPGATGAPGIFANTYLVAESERAAAGGGLVTFSRMFAEIPPGFNDFTTVTYAFPALTTYRPFQKVETVSARVFSDFFLTANPQSVTLSGATRFLNLYGFDVSTLGAGTSTSPNIDTYSGWVGSGTELIPYPATISRYIGPLWRRDTVYVKAL